MLVIGAGVVGMACARALQRSGLAVGVADPQPPGSACSYGNAGVIATEHVLPLARPEVLGRVPGMLLRPGAPLYLKASRLPTLLPWLWRFAAACRADAVTAGSRAIAALTAASLGAWEEELTASGGRHLLKQQGLFTVYRSEGAFRRDAAERARQQELGVAFEALDGESLRRHEPALHRGLNFAVHYPGVAHVLNPQAVVECLGGAFLRDGGRVLAGEARSFAPEPHQVVTRFRPGGGLQAGRVRSRYVVLAAGLGSGLLCRSVGLDVPLAAEMGYHVTYPGAEQRLTAPVASAEDGFIVTPMDGHLRAAGTVELAAREAAPAWRRAEGLARGAARLFREPLPEPAGRWRGSRPTLPDFLPAIGPLPRQPRLIAAFGHQHIGLTTAAVTGLLVRELVRGGRPVLDMAPYDPGRFAPS